MNEPERTITMLAAIAGLRIGEILGLRWGRVHLDRHSMEIEETCYKGVFGSPKSRASRRTAPLAPVVVHALQAHRSRCANTSADALVSLLGVSACRSEADRLAHLTPHVQHVAARSRNAGQGSTNPAWTFQQQRRWTFIHILFPSPNAMRSQSWERFCSQMFPTCTKMQQGRKQAGC